MLSTWAQDCYGAVDDGRGGSGSLGGDLLVDPGRGGWGSVTDEGASLVLPPSWCVLPLSPQKIGRANIWLGKVLFLIAFRGT